MTFLGKIYESWSNYSKFSMLSEHFFYFFIEIKNQLSDFGKVSCDVPQGSILGPLLFLIYVNERPQAVKSNLFLYADDTSHVPT